MFLNLPTVAFWLFLAVVAGALIWRSAVQRREALATLRTAIEKGVPLDDPRLRSLLAGTSRPRLSHDFLLVLGGIVAAGGLCSFVLALFAHEARPLVAIGICAEIFAAALFLLWRVFAHALRNGRELE